jgi:predicted phosphoribosyltransferase
MLRFSDHKTAGELLASLLVDEYAGRTDVVVLALRARATDVARAVASALKRPLAIEVPAVIPSDALEGCTIILVDDGFATARELTELVIEARTYRPARLITAAPIASEDAAAAARKAADDAVFLATPSPFRSVGFWYEDSMRWATQALFAGSRRAARHVCAS